MKLARDIWYEWASWYNRVRGMPQWECNPLPWLKLSSYIYIVRITAGYLGLLGWRPNRAWGFR